MSFKLVAKRGFYRKVKPSFGYIFALKKKESGARSQESGCSNLYE